MYLVFFSLDDFYYVNTLEGFEVELLRGDAKAFRLTDPPRIVHADLNIAGKFIQRETELV